MAARQYEIFDVNEIQKIEGFADHNARVYEAAKMYIAAGFYVIPIVKGGKAIPPKRFEISYGNAAKNRKTMERWFHPSDGKFSGWNIGIATGRNDGVFVLDIDRHGEDDGFATIEEIGEEIPKGPSQATPNGGMHHLFAWQDNASSSTGKIGDGVDTRGGIVDACKGHIVVWPSIVDGKEYKWVTGGPLPSIPKWIMAKMGVPWVARPANSGAGRGNENVDDPDVEEHVPLAQIERMIAHIDPDVMSYDDWLRVGMAIASQHPDDDGLSIWDEWSAHGSRYKPDECRIRWSGFNEFGPVRMATLFYFAQQHGYDAKPKDKKPNKLAAVTERYNQEYAVIVAGNKLRILKELSGKLDPMALKYQLLSRADFSTLQMNDQVWTSPDAKKPTPAAEIWLSDASRRTFPNGLGMFPEGEPEGYFNTYAGLNVEPKEGNCSEFKKHIFDVMCDEDDEIYNYVLDWCADLFQFPGNPKGVAIVMRGDEGTGKGTFANTIGMMCAPHYTHLIDENHLTGQFNSHMAESVVVFADEITWGGNRKTAGKLKGLVTEKYLLLERKGIDAISQRNMVHMLIASNSEWVVPAGINSRRWLVLDVNSSKRSNRKYFNRINDELDGGGREAFLFEMLNRKITANLSLAPETEALQDQRTMSAAQEDNVTRWWRRVLLREKMESDDAQDDNNTQWPSSVVKSDIYDEYERWCMERRLPPVVDGTFFKKLHLFGLSNARVSIRGERVRIFKVPKYDKAVTIVNDITGFTIEHEHEEEDNEES